MNKDESKRLEKLQEYADRGRFGCTDGLSFSDLLLLLREDKDLQKLIRDIVAQPATTDECAADEIDDSLPEDVAENEKIVPFPPIKHHAPLPSDALRQQLAPELTLLKAVQADAEIAAAWLGEQLEEEGRQLLRLVACAAQWDLLSELWEKLANRCKQAQRAANKQELQILQATLALHNLRWQGRQALLIEVESGTAYDYDRHQRGTPTGDKVHALWLPGLVNAGGQLHKKPLVAT